MTDTSKRMKLVYDINAAPAGLDIGNLVKIYESHNVIFWDSSKEGMKPKLYGVDGHEAPLAVVDVEGKEMNLAQFTKDFADEEFWKKELHNCKNSPIYFWSHYGTSCWPYKSAELSEYLKSIGMNDLDNTDTESVKYKKLWAKQVAKVKQTTDKFTIEFLRERKAIVDIVKNKYDEKVAALEILVKGKVKLYETDGTALEPRKQVANLMEKIRREAVLVGFSNYRNKKGKWDVPMLLVTDYPTLLEICYGVFKANGKISESVGATT